MALFIVYRLSNPWGMAITQYSFMKWPRGGDFNHMQKEELLYQTREYIPGLIVPGILIEHFVIIFGGFNPRQV